jgi:undecaprenyl-diphosphatase
MSWDNQLLLFVATHRTAGLDAFFRGITWLGSLYVLSPLAAVDTRVLLLLQKRWEALLLVFGFGGAVLLVHLTKALLARPRPDLFEPLIAMPNGGSFPSAHTTQISAFALCAVLILRRSFLEWQTAAMSVAAIVISVVAISRFYLQVHYSSDVLGGLLCGVAWIALVRRML